MAFVAWRGNGNAHGFYSITFYLFYAESPGSLATWYLVPFEGDRNSPPDNYVTTSQGADCILSDVRLLRSKRSRAPVTLIVGRRAPGASFADTATVTFTRYELARAEPNEVGPQPFYFKAVERIGARNGYCDVNEVFVLELDLGEGH